MEMFSLDLDKYGLKYLETKHLCDYTDGEIDKLTDAFASEVIAPEFPNVMFEPDNIKQLLKLSKCKRCGKCCVPDKRNAENPGVIVWERDLINISKHTKHSLKSLNKIVHINENPVFEVGAKYLQLPCMFYNKHEKSCKIYPHRPFICQIYPISNSPAQNVTISVACEYGKEIFKKTMKYLRDEDRKIESNSSID